MRCKKFLITTAFVISVALTGICAVAAAETDIFSASADVIDRLKSKVTTVKLDNGLTIVMYPRGIAPVFSAVVAVGVGGVDEVDGQTGISHLLEHMAFKGSRLLGGSMEDPQEEVRLLAELESYAALDPTFQKLSPADQATVQQIMKRLSQITPVDEFSREFERRGAVGLNAQTDKDQTKYYVSLPKNSLEYWAFAESEKILSPIMRQFYQERDVVLEERRTRFEDSPAGKLFERLLQVAYPHHPYGLPLIGYEKDIRSLTTKKLDEFRQRFYVPSNIVIALVGEVNVDTDLPLLKKYFGRIPAAQVQRNEIGQPEIPTSETTFTIKDKAKPLFYSAYYKPNYPHKDDAVLSVATEVLNGSSLSPLFYTLVKKERIAVSVSDTEAPGSRYPNLLVFTAVPKSGVSNQVLLKRFDEIVSTALKDPDQSLIDHAKRQIAKSYITSVKSSLSLAALLAEVQLKYGSWEAVVDWYREAMEVSKDDIARAAQEYLVPNNRVVGFLEEEQ